jgi:hypothetical protein
MALVLIGMMTLTAATVGAEERFTTERPSSVLIFPKVVNTSDTVIQITNTTNLLVNVHCFYVNGQVFGGQPIWQVTDFALVLTRQQPTQWSAGAGRAVNPQDINTGLDPGAVPPVVPGFTGFLLCAEVMPSGEPSGANSLKGEATVGQVTSLGGPNHVSKYNAIGIQACGMGGCGGTGTSVNDDNVLDLDNKEFAKCPGGLLLNFEGEDGPDLAIDGASPLGSLVSTNLTLVPCGFDLANVNPSSTFLTLNFRDEFESPGSVSTVPIDCWFSRDLGDPIFGNQLTIGGLLPSTFGTGILRPQTPGDLPALGVANVLHQAGDGSSDTAATNLHFCTDAAAPADCDEVTSQILLPSLP